MQEEGKTTSVKSASTMSTSRPELSHKKEAAVLRPTLTVYNRLGRSVRISLGPAGKKVSATVDTNDKTSCSTESNTVAAGTVASLLIAPDVVRHRRFHAILEASDDEQAAEGFSKSRRESTTIQLRYLSSSAVGSKGPPPSARWKPVSFKDDEPAQESFYALQSWTAGQQNDVRLLLLPRRSTAAFLSDLPDEALLSALCLPGTHETMARYGWPISQCQAVTSTIGAQLRAGIRFMDFRVAARGDKGKERLLAFHGATDEKIELGAALQQVYDFFDGEGARETVIISIKPEGSGSAKNVESLLFSLYVNPDRRRWYLDPTIPRLGEARGKIVMFSRFGASNEQPGGIHPPIWPDNLKDLFRYDLPPKPGQVESQSVVTQDWFSIGTYRSIPDKFNLAVRLLYEAGSDPNVLGLNFLSGSTFPLALPPAVSKGVFESGPKCLSTLGTNVRMRDEVASRLTAAMSANDTAQPSTAQALAALQVTFAIDFYAFKDAPDLVPLLIEANFASPSRDC